MPAGWPLCIQLANLQASRPDEAYQAMQKVIGYFPDNSLIQTDMARVFIGNGKYQEALPYLEKANSLDTSRTPPLGSILSILT